MVYWHRGLDNRVYLMIIREKFFLFLMEKICCGLSSELPCPSSLDEGSQYMFLCKLNKNYS